METIPQLLVQVPLKQTCHLLDWCSTAQRRVTRSTFSSELLAAVDAVDSVLLVREILREISTGEQGSHLARKHIEEPNVDPGSKLQLFIDAKSVLDALGPSLGGALSRFQPRNRKLFTSIGFENVWRTSFCVEYPGAIPVIWWLTL
eukprot:4502021-Amphidinium_carterae.1